MNDIQEFVSLAPNFQAEGQSIQQWIIAREDLNTVYVAANNDKVTLWCSNKVDPLEQVLNGKNTDAEGGTPASKTNECEQEICRWLINWRVSILRVTLFLS